MSSLTWADMHVHVDHGCYTRIGRCKDVFAHSRLSDIKIKWRDLHQPFKDGPIQPISLPCLFFVMQTAQFIERRKLCDRQKIAVIMRVLYNGLCGRQRGMAAACMAALFYLFQGKILSSLCERRKFRRSFDMEWRWQAGRALAGRPRIVRGKTEPD